MGGMKSLLDQTRLPKHYEDAFEKLQDEIDELIDRSLDEAYYGLLPYDPHPVAQIICDKPIAADRAHQLLTEMWGDLLTKDAIDDACARFMDQDTAHFKDK
jgi:hypothetical protein